MLGPAGELVEPEIEHMIEGQTSEAIRAEEVWSDRAGASGDPESSLSPQRPDR